MANHHALFEKLTAIMGSEPLSNGEAYTLAVNLMAFVLVSGSAGAMPAPGLVDTICRDVIMAIANNTASPQKEKIH